MKRKINILITIVLIGNYMEKTGYATTEIYNFLRKKINIPSKRFYYTINFAYQIGKQGKIILFSAVICEQKNLNNGEIIVVCLG